jgi:calmodulin
MEEEEFDKLNKLKDAFEIFDKSKDGTITIKEVTDLLTNLGHKLTESEIQNMIDEVDNGKNKIDFIDFMSIMSRKMRDSDPEEELIEVYKMFDKDGNGLISGKEIKQVFVGDLTDEEINEIIKEADDDGDGNIDYENFVRLIKDN